jgi:hypothetical protein
MGDGHFGKLMLSVEWLPDNQILNLLYTLIYLNTSANIGTSSLFPDSLK